MARACKNLVNSDEPVVKASSVDFASHATLHGLMLHTTFGGKGNNVC